MRRDVTFQRQNHTRQSLAMKGGVLAMKGGVTGDLESDETADTADSTINLSDTYSLTFRQDAPPVCPNNKYL